jgi:hypothetical protein
MVARMKPSFLTLREWEIVYRQGIKRGRKARLTTKSTDYKLGLAVLALCRQLNILKHNFHFMQ